MRIAAKWIAYPNDTLFNKFHLIYFVISSFNASPCSNEYVSTTNHTKIMRITLLDFYCIAHLPVSMPKLHLDYFWICSCALFFGEIEHGEMNQLISALQTLFGIHWLQCQAEAKRAHCCLFEYEFWNSILSKYYFFDCLVSSVTVVLVSKRKKLHLIHYGSTFSFQWYFYPFQEKKTTETFVKHFFSRLENQKKNTDADCGWIKKQKKKTPVIVES